MKLSIFTTSTSAKSRGDNLGDAIICYHDLADEVVIVEGSDKDGGMTLDGTLNIVSTHWPKEFDWSFIGQQFQRGYEACTGDWVIHADLDFLFHENDFLAIRDAINYYNDQPALSFWKYQFILPDRYNIKSRLVIALNKAKFGDRLKFDSGGDLTQVSLDGKYLTPDSVPEARVPIYNYECLLKTKRQLLEDKGRFARAWQRTFGEYKLGGPDDKSAYKEWLGMVVGRFNKPQEFVRFNQHPKYIQETIENLQPKNWGFSGLGNLELNQYAQGR